MKKLLALVRISKPSYNETLHGRYTMYMNSQKKYRDSSLTEGQYDKYEGAIAIAPFKIRCLEDNKEVEYELASDSIVYKENKACIFVCMRLPLIKILMMRIQIDFIIGYRGNT